MRIRGGPGRSGAVAVLVASLLAVAAACGADGAEPAGGRFDPVEPGVLTVATRPLPAEGLWEGTAAAPTGGFEYELAVALADRLGLDGVRVVEVPFAALVAGDLGGADVALAQITPTKGRDEVLDFSAPYLAADGAALAPAGTDLRDLAGARDLRWAAQEASTNLRFLRDVVRPTEPARAAPDRGSVLALLDDGTVDAVLLDAPVAAVLAARSDGRLTVPARFDTGGTWAVALPPGSDDVEAVDSALRALLADGTVDELARRRLGTGTSGGRRTDLDVPLIRTRS